MVHGSDGVIFLDKIIESKTDPKFSQDTQAGNRVLYSDAAHSHIMGMSEQSAADWLRGIQ